MRKQKPTTNDKNATSNTAGHAVATSPIMVPKSTVLAAALIPSNAAPAAAEAAALAAPPMGILNMQMLAMSLNSMPGNGTWGTLFSKWNAVLPDHVLVHIFTYR